MAWIERDVKGAELADLDLIVERAVDHLPLSGYQLDHEFCRELRVALGGEPADGRGKPRGPLLRYGEQARLQSDRLRGDCFRTDRRARAEARDRQLRGSKPVGGCDRRGQSVRTRLLDDDVLLNDWLLDDD